MIDLGKYHKLEISKIERIDFGGEKCGAIIVKDMNVYEELELEKVNKRYKEMLVLCISHELRTPLNGIVGVAEILDDVNLPPDNIKQYTRQIKNSGYLLKHLIDSVQDLMRIESNNFILNNTQFQIIDTVKDCLDIIISEFHHRNILIETDFSDPYLCLFINADRNRYSQVILSLLINSAKYTYEGKIRIIINYDTRENLFITTIEDTGIGIDPEFLPYIFNLFGKIKCGKLSHTEIEGNILSIYNI